MAAGRGPPPSLVHAPATSYCSMSVIARAWGNMRSRLARAGALLVSPFCEPAESHVDDEGKPHAHPCPLATRSASAFASQPPAITSPARPPKNRVMESGTGSTCSPLLDAGASSWQQPAPPSRGSHPGKRLMTLHVGALSMLALTFWLMILSNRHRFPRPPVALRPNTPPTRLGTWHSGRGPGIPGTVLPEALGGGSSK
jgi:hypothetical protein